MTKKPNFFIVGAPKCGTTAMFQYLGLHPDIYTSPHKEPHYFGSDLIWSTRFRDPAQYLSFFSDWNDEKRGGESSVMYLYSKTAAEEIKAFSPDANIIIMLRNPVDAMYSLHQFALFTGDEDIPSFEEALAAQTERKLGRRLPQTDKPGIRQVLFYTDIFKYVKQIERYYKAFGQGKVHVILFDDFVAATAHEYAKTLEFLGVDPTFVIEHAVVNAGRQIRNPAIWRLLRFPPATLRSVWRIAPKSVRSTLLKGIATAASDTKKASPIRPETKSYLLEQFRNEIEQLSILLSRDLSHWTAGRKDAEGSPERQLLSPTKQ